jgi:hypothetical protein
VRWFLRLRRAADALTELTWKPGNELCQRESRVTTEDAGWIPGQPLQLISKHDRHRIAVPVVAKGGRTGPEAASVVVWNDVKRGNATIDERFIRNRRIVLAVLLRSA